MKLNKSILRLITVFSLFNFSSKAFANPDLLAKIDRCEASGNSKCIFELLRELAKSNLNSDNAIQIEEGKYFPVKADGSIDPNTFDYRIVTRKNVTTYEVAYPQTDSDFYITCRWNVCRNHSFFENASILDPTIKVISSTKFEVVSPFRITYTKY